MFRTLTLDGAVQLFDPASSLRVVLEGPGTRTCRQTAPHSVQFSLTNACNLTCGFCSRPQERESTWTTPSCVALLADLDRLGVAEVAFGGGEPLLYPGFVELIDELHANTRLALHFTTNGLRLDARTIERLQPKIGEVRLSLYDDNDWRATVARLVALEQRFGVNLIVGPDVAFELDGRLDELASLGCSDVLLLPALGEPQLALDGRALARVRSVLEARLGGEQILKLSVCWGPQLDGLPRLFPREDCGAGREFLEITSDREVRACSFHARSLPFESAEDILHIWRDAREQLDAPAGCSGCPRGEPARSHGTAENYTARIFAAFASNNSGSYTLLGSFETREKAEEVTATLTGLAEAMAASEDSDTNPLAELLRAANLEALDDVGRRGDWPEYGAEPEAVRVGHQVWWFADYTVTMPKAIGAWFYALGGRVSTELDHAHHPLVARMTLWPDLPWSERFKMDLKPFAKKLERGPLAVEGITALVRLGAHSSIDVLWRDPTPDAMRALVAHVEAEGFQLRLELNEAFTDDPDLESLWSRG